MYRWETDGNNRFRIRTGRERLVILFGKDSLTVEIYDSAAEKPRSRVLIEEDGTTVNTSPQRGRMGYYDVLDHRKEMLEAEGLGAAEKQSLERYLRMLD